VLSLRGSFYVVCLSFSWCVLVVFQSGAGRIPVATRTAHRKPAGISISAPFPQAEPACVHALSKR
jgi:hypothetical protein